MLAAPNGEFVETGVAMNVTSLADMTKSGFSAFARMKKIEYQCETGMCSESIASYKFLNESWMAIYGERGTTALISNGLTSIRGPATGVVTFNNGVAQLAGKGYPTEHLTMATEACAAQNCPNAKCSVRASSSTSFAT